MLESVINSGDVFRVKYPFVRVTVEVPDSDPEGQGFATIQSWRPGVEFVPCGPCGDDSEAQCNAEGEMVLTVVDVHKPGKFPARVFFTRQWVDPNGKAFGKGKLHIMTAQAFKRRARGYMHEYEITPECPS
ncbi:MAG: hypothetical protein V4858_17335 [Pseudomonadota bacterium]